MLELLFFYPSLFFSPVIFPRTSTGSEVAATRKMCTFEILSTETNYKASIFVFMRLTFKQKLIILLCSTKIVVVFVVIVSFFYFKTPNDVY